LFSNRRVAWGKVGKTLHDECLDDGTWIGEPGLQGCDRAPAFGSVQLQTRNHGGKVPAHFLLGCFGQQAEQFLFIGLKKRPVFTSCFFSRIRGPHPHHRVRRIPEALDEMPELFGIPGYQSCNLISVPDRSPAATAE